MGLRDREFVFITEPEAALEEWLDDLIADPIVPDSPDPEVLAAKAALENGAWDEHKGFVEEYVRDQIWEILDSRGTSVGSLAVEALAVLQRRLEADLT